MSKVEFFFPLSPPAGEEMRHVMNMIWIHEHSTAPPELVAIDTQSLSHLFQSG